MTQTDDTRSVGQHHGDLRRALLDAALELVDEKDAASLSMRAVARRAGVSSGAPYHHFEDKGALLAAVAIEGFHALRRAQDAALATSDDPQVRLSRLCAAYVRFAVAHRTHYAVMFDQPPHQVAPHAGTPLRSAALAAFQVLVQAIAATGPDRDAEAIRRDAVIAWSLAHGAVDVVDWLPGLPDSSGKSEPRAAPIVDALAADVGAAVVRLCTL